MSPERWLATVVRYMPADRAEWGAAMLAEMHEVEPSGRWRFALSCTQVALFPPAPEGRGSMSKVILFTLALAALAGFALWQPETGGTWLAQAIGIYAWALFVSKIFLFDLLVLAVLTWSLVKRGQGVQPWQRVPAVMQQRGRLAAEIYFGLLNPVLYLAVLTSGPQMLSLRLDPAAGPWIAVLYAVAAGLLVTLWGWRLCGASFSPSAVPPAVARGLLWTSLACLGLYCLKDLALLWRASAEGTHWGVIVPGLLLLSPMYLIPGVLIYDYLRESGKTPHAPPAGFFLLNDRTARAALGAAAVVAVLAVAFSLQRRSDQDVRALVMRHQNAIHAAAARYDTDPKLIAAIVYVTHRDQLSPFRDSIERIFSTAWTVGLPDRYLNRVFDLSLGLAQIKPRTVQTGTVLAVGGPKAFHQAGLVLIENVGEGMFEPVGAGWPPPPDPQLGLEPPLPVFAARQEIVTALLTPRKNLDTCAFLLALYQRQWENANPAWSIRRRPEILATLYQIGFAKSKPHGAPRSNAFGERVLEVYGQKWLARFTEAPR